MDTVAPGPGHNHPNDALDPELIADQLGLSYAHHLRRRDELTLGLLRFVLAHGTLTTVATAADLAGVDKRQVFCEADNTLYQRTVRRREGDPEWQPATDVPTLVTLIHSAAIRDDASRAKVISFTRQLKETAKAVELDRKRELAPYDGAWDAVQAFFAAGIVERLTYSAKALEGVLNTYDRWKVEQERVRREEEAQRARDDANRLAAAAAATEHPEVIETAIAVNAEADRKERQAAAPVADLGRGRGSLGGTSSFRRDWTITVRDKMALPERYLLVDLAAITRDVRAAKGEIEITGVEITETSKTVVV